jgi:hypothetical protein
MKTKIYKRQGKDKHLLNHLHPSASNARHTQASKTQTLGQRCSLPQSSNPHVEVQMILYIFFTAIDDAMHLSINIYHISLNIFASPRLPLTKSKLMTWISYHQYGYGINRKLRDTRMHVQTNMLSLVVFHL